jgi:hypothetical protein
LALAAACARPSACLRRAGHSELYCKVRRDAVIIFCLEHGYSRFECDDELFRLGEKTIGADGAGAVD